YNQIAHVTHSTRTKQTKGEPSIRATRHRLLAAVRTQCSYLLAPPDTTRGTPPVGSSARGYRLRLRPRGWPRGLTQRHHTDSSINCQVVNRCGRRAGKGAGQQGDGCEAVRASTRISAGYGRHAVRAARRD